MGHRDMMHNKKSSLTIMLTSFLNGERKKNTHIINGSSGHAQKQSPNMLGPLVLVLVRARTCENGDRTT